MDMDEPSPTLKSEPKPKASFLSSIFSWASSDKNKKEIRKVPEAVPEVLVRKPKRKMMARLEREEVVDEVVFEAMPMKKCAMAAPKMAGSMPEANEASKDRFLDEFVKSAVKQVSKKQAMKRS